MFATGCPRLSFPNGTLYYSNSLLIGSVATYNCHTTNDYILTQGSAITRTCTMNGWTGVDITCECKTFQHKF